MPSAPQVLAPKQAALGGLHQQTVTLPLDSLLLFSSVAALLGSPGQANYSAANSVLDAAAQRAQLAGAPAASVQWGAWAGAGMAAQDASTAARLERLGMGLLSISSGLAALAAAVGSSGGGGSGAAVLAAVPFRWRQLVAAARKPLPQRFAPYASGAATVTRRASTAPAPAALAAALDAAEVQAAVEDAVRGILGADVGADEPLMAAGLDSLGAVELRSSLEGRLGLALPSTLVFDYPTVASLSAFLASKLAGPSGAAAAAVPGGLALLRRASTAAAAPAADGGAVVMLGASWRSPQRALGQLATTAGVDAVGLVPLERWDVEAEPLAARFGAYLSDVASFDATALGVSDAEAALLDPQQRLLLEAVGEALLGAPVDAALAPLRARGIYVGAWGAGCCLAR